MAWAAKASASMSWTSTGTEATAMTAPERPAGVGEGELVAVGRIGKAHGLRGEVAVEAWSDDPAGRFAVGVVLRAQKTGQAWVVEAARLHGDRWLVSFAGVPDRTSAEALRGTVLVMPASQRPPIDDPDEFYDSDLVGLEARDPDGAPLGAVTEVVHSAGGVHLVLARPVDNAADAHADAPAPGADTGAGAGAVREHLVPFVGSIVPRVDLEAGMLIIDAPAGLFDL